MLGMIISRASSSFRVVGCREKQLWLFLGKLFRALAPSLISGLYCKFTQSLGILISPVKSTFRMLGSRSRPLRLFSKKIVVALMITQLIDFNIPSHKCLVTNVWYDYISSRFNIQVAWLKVKVTVAFFSEKKNNFVTAITPAFILFFLYIFTQLLGMMISRASLTFRVLGLKSRTLQLSLEKLCYYCPNLKNRSYTGFSLPVSDSVFS